MSTDSCGVSSFSCAGLLGRERLGLDRGDRDGVDDVLHERTAGEVVDRHPQSLQDRSDGDRAGGPLDGLVRVVPGVGGAGILKDQCWPKFGLAGRTQCWLKFGL